MSLYWLTYQTADERVLGVVLIQAGDLIDARLRAKRGKLDQGAKFAAGYELDDEHAALMPEGARGRMLSPREAHGLIDLIERGA